MLTTCFYFIKSFFKKQKEVWDFSLTGLSKFSVNSFSWVLIENQYALSFDGGHVKGMRQPLQSHRIVPLSRLMKIKSLTRNYRNHKMFLILWKTYFWFYQYVMRCAIWYHLYNLKNVKNIHGEVLLLVTFTFTFVS